MASRLSSSMPKFLLQGVMRHLTGGTIEPLMKADNKDPAKDINAFWDYFERSFEQTASHWHYRDQYLSDFRQEPDETTADLDLRIRELVKGCKFPEDQVECRRLELLFHATNLFLIHEHITGTPGVKYEDCIQKAKQHERTVSDFKDHASSRGATGSSIPSFQDPLLTAHAVQQRRRRPTGRRDGTCGKCGRSHERGNCPAYGTKCFKCGGMNHFKQHSAVPGTLLPAPRDHHRSRKASPSSTETDGHLVASKARARDPVPKEEEEAVHPTRRRNNHSRARTRRTA